MSGTKARQEQLKRLFKRQGGRCWWCGVGMVPPGTYKAKGKPDPRLCTYDHMDCRFSDDRGKHAGEFRNVAACWTCNNRRAAMQQANMAKEILWEKSRAYPRDHPKARTGRGARDGATSVERLARHTGNEDKNIGNGEA